jgi:hypothetical protein
LLIKIIEKFIAFCPFFLLFYNKLACYVKKLKTYLFFHSFIFASLTAYCQNNEATVTIVGNPVDQGNQYSNAYQTNEPPPPAQQQFATTEQNIEPTLENGFHMRFQLESPGSVERINSVNTASSFSSGSGAGGAGVKVKKRSVSISERTFNVKKKLKNKMPKFKKKYHPTLCEKFR